jgi:hypothetical protein
MRTAAGRNQTALAGDLKRVVLIGAFVAIPGSQSVRRACVQVCALSIF